MCLQVQNGFVRPGQTFTIGYGSFGITASKFDMVSGSEGHYWGSPACKLHDHLYGISTNLYSVCVWYCTTLTCVYIHTHIHSATFVDYYLLDGSLMLDFDNQNVPLCVPIPIINDSHPENEECFRIFFFGMDGTPLLDVQPNQARVCITDTCKRLM